MKLVNCLVYGILLLAGAITTHAKDLLEITLVGEVKQPKRIAVAAEVSLSHALEKNGGISVWGSPRRLILIRVVDKITEDVEKVSTVIKEIHLKHGENPSLKELGISSGDIIYVCKKRLM